MAPQNIGSSPNPGNRWARATFREDGPAGAAVREIIRHRLGGHGRRTDINLIRVTPNVKESLLRELTRAMEGGVSRAAPYPRAPGEPWLHWEIRARTRSGRAREVSLDGGARVEKRKPGATAVTGWRFAVGAGPEALQALVSEKTPSFEASRRSWDRFVAEMRSLTCETWRRWRRELATVEADLPALAAGHLRLEAETSLRLRCIAAPGDEPRVDSARSLRLSLRTADPRVRRATPLYEWSAPAAADGPLLGQDVAVALEVATGSQRERRDGPLPRVELEDGYEGPIVLLREAAAWWVHEMAHAAFEREAGAGATGGDGLRIVEEPSGGTWPYGFTTDDVGASASRTVLWGSGAERGVPSVGHHRRSSIRDTARPGPSVTRMTCDHRPRRGVSDLPAGWPVAASVDAARFDPSTGRILLSVDRLGVTTGSGWHEAPWSAVVTVDDVAGWRGVEPLIDARPRFDVHAVCTREGRMNPVMVGAPTVALKTVRLLRC